MSPKKLSLQKQGVAKWLESCESSLMPPKKHSIKKKGCKKVQKSKRSKRDEGKISKAKLRNFNDTYKSKRSKRDEGKISKAKLRNFNDTYKDRQNGEICAVTTKRLSMQGTRNVQSKMVRRGFGLSKEAQKRAQANLSRILELANGVREGPSEENVSDLSSLESQVSQNDNPPALGESSKETEETNSTRKRQRSNSIDKQDESPELQRTYYQELLANATCEGIRTTSRYAKCAEDRQELITNKLLRQLGDKCRKGGQGRLTSTVNNLLLRRRKESKEKDNPKNDAELPEIVSLDTANVENKTKANVFEPIQNSKLIGVAKAVQTIEFQQTSYCIEIPENSQKSLQCYLETPVIPQAVDTPVPGTVITSPRTFLGRYEEKCKKRKMEKSRQCIPDHPGNFNHDFKHKLKKGENNLHREVQCRKLSISPGEEKYRTKKVEMALKKTCQPELRIRDNPDNTINISANNVKCPGTIIINPLDYIKRYKKESDSLQLESVSSNSNPIAVCNSNKSICGTVENDDVPTDKKGCRYPNVVYGEDDFNNCVNIPNKSVRGCIDDIQVNRACNLMPTMYAETLNTGRTGSLQCENLSPRPFSVLHQKCQLPLNEAVFEEISTFPRYNESSRVVAKGAPNCRNLVDLQEISCQETSSCHPANNRSSTICSCEGLSSHGCQCGSQDYIDYASRFRPEKCGCYSSRDLSLCANFGECSTGSSRNNLRYQKPQVMDYSTQASKHQFYKRDYDYPFL